MTGSTLEPPFREARVWVLLEGSSEVAAVRVVAQRAGVSLEDRAVELVDMRGATNIRRHLHAAAAARVSPRVLGMCDAPEAAFFVRALRRVGCAVEAVEDLPAWGFQVCDRDLEDELVRHLGEPGTRAVLEELGLSQRFAMLSQQPAWVHASFHDRVHRFAGAASGRKELMAGALAGALDLDALPSPLVSLLDAISRSGPTFEEVRGAVPGSDPTAGGNGSPPRPARAPSGGPLPCGSPPSPTRLAGGFATGTNDV